MACAGLACGCGQSPPRAARVKHSQQVMGTFAEVTAIAASETAATAAVDAAYVRIGDVNRLMSDYVADSEVSQLKRLMPGQSVAVSPETFHCLQRAAEVSEASGGAFDVTCRPLVWLWKQAGEAGALPSDDKLTATRARVDWRNVLLTPDGRHVSIAAPLVEIDLGGIAKGYALDLAAAAMKAAGATGGLVDIGGDVLGFGTNEKGEPWRVGVKHPFRQGLYGAVELRDRAVATSGVQQRFIEIEGRRYSHIIDPRTGWPAAEAPSVTVVARDGLTADAWATVFSVVTLDEGRRLAATLEGVGVLWLSGSADSLEVATAGDIELLEP